MKISRHLFKENSELRIYHGTSVEALLQILRGSPLQIKPSKLPDRVNSYVFFYSFPSHYGNVSISYPLSKLRPQSIQKLILNNMREAGVDTLEELQPGLGSITEEDLLHLSPQQVLDIVKRSELELLWSGPFYLTSDTEIEVSKSSELEKSVIDEIADLAKKKHISVKFL